MENEKDILKKAIQLIEWHKAGQLGGEVMPEDKNPEYPIDSKENYLYFTLPMALNYQRNSYTLWESAYASAIDSETKDIFVPEKVLAMNEEELRGKLTKHKVALQKNKQPLIWQRLCHTFQTDFDGDVREFFKRNDYSIEQTKKYMLEHKKDFPYLSGNKIMNYWLYVMTQYTDLVVKDRWNISVAPDTHVVKASLKLGVINELEYSSSNAQQVVAERWMQLFSDSSYEPIDIHTPLWLWSRNNFEKMIID